MGVSKMRIRDKSIGRKGEYKTIPLHPETYSLIKSEKKKLQENFGRKITWDELISLLFEFKKMLINDD